MNTNVFLLFFSFVFSLSSNWERERERERGYIKLGIRRNSPKVYLSYFNGFLWRIFLLLRALLLPGVLGFSSVHHKLCPTTNFLIIYFCWWEGVPTSVLGSQPIIWLLSSSPLARQSVRATICHPVSHSFSIRSPSTNTCFSILTWICYFGFVILGLTHILSCLNGHSLMACHC